jgi:hypothetical protein
MNMDRDFSKSDIVTFIIKENIVNSSMPTWQDINMGENTALWK